MCLLGTTPHHYHETERTDATVKIGTRARANERTFNRITLKYKIGKSKYFHWQFAYNTLRGYVQSECVHYTATTHISFLCHAQSKPLNRRRRGNIATTTAATIVIIAAASDKQEQEQEQMQRATTTQQTWISIINNKKVLGISNALPKNHITLHKATETANSHSNRA